MHQAEYFVPNKDMDHAMEQSFEHHSAVLGGVGFTGMRQPLNTVGGRRFERCTDAEYKQEDEHGKRGVDRNFRLSLKYVNNIQKRPHRYMKATINKLRMLTTEQEVMERPAL